jgi:hypothetical protein
MANDYDAMPIDDFFSWTGRTGTSGFQFPDSAQGGIVR